MHYVCRAFFVVPSDTIPELQSLLILWKFLGLNFTHFLHGYIKIRRESLRAGTLQCDNNIHEGTLFCIDSYGRTCEHRRALRFSHVVCVYMKNITAGLFRVRTMHVEEEVNLIFKSLEVAPGVSVKNNNIYFNPLRNKILMTTEYLSY